MFEICNNYSNFSGFSVKFTSLRKHYKEIGDVLIRNKCNNIFVRKTLWIAFLTAASEINYIGIKIIIKTSIFGWLSVSFKLTII